MSISKILNYRGRETDLLVRHDVPYAVCIRFDEPEVAIRATGLLEMTSSCLLFDGVKRVLS
jgi:hypothetical protein